METGGQGLDIGSMLNSVLENPEAMKRVAQLAGSIMGDGGTGGPAKEEPSDHKPAPPESGEKKGDGGGSDNRAALLRALKPYLNAERRKKVDSLLQILKLLQLAEASGLLKEFGLGK